jgi:hypothetical protein
MSSYESWISNPKETHGPLMSVVTWSLVSVSGAFLIPRLYVRHRQGKLWLDDCTLAISWVSPTTFDSSRDLLILYRFYF